MNVKRKIVALFMIMVMVLTVTTVAVTAKPANAASTPAPVPVGSANVQAPALVGSTVGVGTPAIAYLEGGITFFIFVRGTDGALWVTHWGGMFWSSPMSLGGRLTSDPAVLSTPDGFCVAVRGTDGALWGNYYNLQDGSWTGWQYFGGQLLAGTGPGAGRYDAYSWFVTGTNHGLFALNVCGGVWENLGGYLTSSPGAAAPSKDAIKAFVRGGDGALWVKSGEMGQSCNGIWTGWQSLGGQIALGTGPAASSYGSRFDVFVQGTDGAVWHRGYTGTWSNWQSLGGKLTSSPVAATIPSFNSLWIDVIGRGTDGTLWHNYYNGGWSGWMQEGGGM
jgi:hypothetical protein